jgi:hypothetical protein
LTTGLISKLIIVALLAAILTQDIRAPEQSMQLAMAQVPVVPIPEAIPAPPKVEPVQVKPVQLECPTTVIQAAKPRVRKAKVKVRTRRVVAEVPQEPALKP